MDNGLYITLSRQLALFRDMDATANNIANANSAGYTSEHVMFNTYLTKDNNLGVHNKNTYAHDVSTYRNTENGPLQSTGNPLDVAIKGGGYFMVETPLGPRYTRAGNFQISSDGTLMNASGHAVLSPSGSRIVFPDNVKDVEIGSVGNIKVNGDDFGILGIVQFDNEQLLEPAGHGLYKTDVTPLPATDAVVAQGVLEGSNVKPVQEMTHMIHVSRSVGETIKFVSAMYELQRKAADTWARQG